MLFYLPDFQNPILPETEAQHCLIVLRCKKGDRVRFTDGKGNLGLGEILSEKTKNCSLKILEIKAFPKNWVNEIWLAVAPTKQLDRMEWMVEKCTEIGVDGFIFLKTQRTERPVLNLDRLEKVALSAMKQSGQYHLPKMHWISDWKAFPWDDFQNLYCADLGSQAKPFISERPGKSLLFIGPEGDFTPTETQEMYEHGAIPIRLRPQVLRTETAGVYALSLFHFSIGSGNSAP